MVEIVNEIMTILSECQTIREIISIASWFEPTIALIEDEGFRLKWSGSFFYWVELKLMIYE